MSDSIKKLEYHIMNTVRVENKHSISNDDLILANLKKMIAESPSCSDKIKIKRDKRYAGLMLYYKRKYVFNCEAREMYYYLAGFIDAKDLE